MYKVIALRNGCNYRGTPMNTSQTWWDYKEGDIGTAVEIQGRFSVLFDNGIIKRDCSIKNFKEIDTNE